MHNIGPIYASICKLSLMRLDKLYGKFDELAEFKVSLISWTSLRMSWWISLISWMS